MRGLFTSVFAAGCVLVGSAAAHAGLLVPGSVQMPAAAEADPVGGIVVASALNAFASPTNFSGTVLTQVISGDASNPFGGLTFVYTVTHDGLAGTNAIGRVTVDSWTGWATDASYSVTSLGLAPASITRDPGAGDVIGFNFFASPLDPLTGFLTPGISSRTLVIQTNATNFATGNMFVIDGGIASVGVFTAAIPAPGALALLAVGTLMGRSRRRR